METRENSHVQPTKSASQIYTPPGHLPRPLFPVFFKSSKSIRTTSQVFLSMTGTGTEDPPGMQAYRLSHPPRTPPQCFSMSSLNCERMETRNELHPRLLFYFQINSIQEHDIDVIPSHRNAHFFFNCAGIVHMSRNAKELLCKRIADSLFRPKS
jgi:hypothetical protein